MRKYKVKFFSAVSLDSLEQIINKFCEDHLFVQSIHYFPSKEGAGIERAMIIYVE